MVSFEYSHFIKQLVKSDLKIKYKGSIFGILWALLEPLLKFIVMFIVFSFVFQSSIQNYPLYLFSGILLWNYFENSSKSSVNRIVHNANLIKKVNFPRELLVISGVISTTIFFLIELVPLMLLLIYYRVFSGFYLLLFIPFLLALFTLNLGLGFFLSSTNVYMRDVQYIWNVILQAGFFATPIFYQVSSFPKKIEYLISLNPITGFLNFFRETIIYGVNIPIITFTYSCFFSIIIFLIGYCTFQHYKKGFAEKV